MTNHTLKNNIVNVIKQNKKFAVISHNGLDGDAIGSMLAFTSALKTIDKEVNIITESNIPKRYEKIFKFDYKNEINKKYDVIFLLDCSDLERTVSNIRNNYNKLIIIDHHEKIDSIADICLQEEKSSTGMILYDIINLICDIDEYIATCLYLTIRTDTGNFKNSNTNYNTFEISAELLKKGANINIINEICEIKSISLFKLLGEVSNNLYYDKKYNLIYLIIKEDNIKLAGSSYEEACMLIDYIKTINNNLLTLVFIENNQYIRIKARSSKINVCEVMKQFDGGGHKGAAGGKIYSKDIYSVTNKVLDTFKEHINNKKLL